MNGYTRHEDGSITLSNERGTLTLQPSQLAALYYTGKQAYDAQEKGGPVRVRR